MRDSYKDAPPSLMIERAMREGNASLAKPREILIDLLREIDNGLDIDLCVVAYRFSGDPPPRGRAGYSQAGGVVLHDSLGLIERVKHLMQRNADE